MIVHQYLLGSAEAVGPGDAVGVTDRSSLYLHRQLRAVSNWSNRCTHIRCEVPSWGARHNREVHGSRWPSTRAGVRHHYWIRSGRSYLVGCECNLELRWTLQRAVVKSPVISDGRSAHEVRAIDI